MIAQDVSSDILIEAAQEVFDTMIFMDLKPVTDSHQHLDGDVVLSCITYNGAVAGCFGFGCQVEGATAIAKSMLGLSPTDSLSREEVQDAVGEVANMVMGNMKTMLADVLGDIQISIPTVIWGQHIEHGLSEQSQKLYYGVTLAEVHRAELSFFWHS